MTAAEVTVLEIDQAGPVRFCDRGGVSVHSHLPIQLSRAATSLRSSAIRDLLAITERPEILSLAGGLPLEEAFPTAEVAAATESVLSTHGGRALQYSTTAGHLGLREWAGARIGAPADQVVITHGSQQSLELLVRALVDPGATVALADPAYIGALQALRLAGAELLAIPRDTDGLRVDVLADRLEGGARPALVYVVANFDNPTGSTLSLERRRALAGLADHYGFVIIDDDPYGDLRWAGEALPPLASMSDRVVTLGTTSKILCPGLRVGWAVGPAEVCERLVLLKQATDLHTATLNQLVVHHLLTAPGFLDERIPRLRATYQGHADALVAALRDQVGDALRFTEPEGGMFLWADTPGLDPDALLSAALSRGVAFVPGSAFSVEDRPSAALRLSFATADPETLATAARRLAAALDDM